MFFQNVTPSCRMCYSLYDIDYMISVGSNHVPVVPLVYMITAKSDPATVGAESGVSEDKSSYLIRLVSGLILSNFSVWEGFS